MNVLVTDGENRSSLAVTRSLGRKGYKVIVCGKEFRNISSVSRFCSKAYKVGDHNLAGESYIYRMLDIIIKENVQMVIPTSDTTIYILNENRRHIPQNTIVACPERDKVEAISNKYSLLRLAEANGVLIPTTVFVKNKKDYYSNEPQLPEFPVVLKPFKSRIPVGSGFIATEVTYANSRRELENSIERSAVLDYPFLIQEKITGAGVGLFTLFDNNRHIALFAHKRLQEKPPSGGVSVFCESVSLDEEMVEAATKLLSAVEWTGVAMVEFKRDRRDGKAKLMEINGRFWGSLQLAIEAGIDFPYLLTEYYTGKKPETLLSEYSIGIRLKWVLGALDYLLIRLKNRDRKLNLPEEHPSKIEAIMEFMKIKQGNTTFDVIDRKDLMPFVYECKDYILQMLNNAI